MEVVICILLTVIWLNAGIFAARSMNDLDGATPLESLVLPLRLVIIVLAPLILLTFERHLFYSKAEPGDNC